MTFHRPEVPSDALVHFKPVGWSTRVSCKPSLALGAFWDDHVRKHPDFIVVETDEDPLRCTAVSERVTCADCSAVSPSQLRVRALEKALRGLLDASAQDRNAARAFATKVLSEEEAKHDHQ